MKNKITTILSLIMLLLSVSLYSQNIPTDKSKFLKFETSQESSKLSLSTKFILQEAKQNQTNDVTKVNLNSLVRITLLFEGECQNFNEKNIFSSVSRISENISTAFVKIENLPFLESIQCLKYADIGEKLNLEVNNARNTTNTNSVHMGTGISQAYTGTGVIVGVIDEGFDYTHPNFKDINGNLRISRVWERTNSAGTPPTSLGFTYGSEYIGSTAILNKQKDMIDKSHGTHVAGTAVGTGTGNLSLLKGMAPNAEIVLVSGFNTVTPTDNNYIDAITYIKNYAALVNKPVVINMSFGTGIGPHDGTTIEETAINSMANTQKLVLVAAAGNDGGKRKHALLNYTNEINKFLVLDYTTPVVNNTQTAANFSTVDIWSQNLSTSGSFEFVIWVENILSGTTDSLPVSGIVNGTGSQTYNLIDTDNCSGCTNDQYSVILNSEINPINNKMHLTIVTSNDNNTAGDRLVIAIKSANNTIHAWSNNCEFGSYTGYNFTQGDDYFTVGSPGTATGVITVGSYNVTNENLGNPPGTVGGLSHFSSKGPRADSNLTIKPDVTAPGNRIVSSLSSFDSTYQSGGLSFSDVTNTYGTHSYGKMQGTSMASPVVTGIVALWLQAYPQLTTNNVRSIIANTSITLSPVSDQFLFYGNTFSTPPNVKWGYGKIDALAGMQLIEQALNIDTFDNSNSFVVYPNPTTSKIFITSKENVGTYEMYNTLGQKVGEGAFNDSLDDKELDLSNLQNGLYILNFKGINFNKTVKIIKQ
jgi:subtilisin family serine protease